MDVCYFPTRFSVSGAALQLPMIRLHSGPKNHKSLRVGPEHLCFLKLLGTQARAVCAQGTYKITHLWVSNVSVNTGIACRFLRTQMSRPHRQVSDLGDLGWDLRILLSLKLPGGANAAGSGTAPWDLLMETSFSHCPPRRPRGKGGRGDCGLPLPLNKSVSASPTLRLGVLSGIPFENKLLWLKTSESHQPSQVRHQDGRDFPRSHGNFFPCHMKI